MSKKDQQFQEFLDTHQYARKGILLYERIFGDTYVSTGGEATTKDFCSGLTLSGLKVNWWFIQNKNVTHSHININMGISI